jgi:ribosomal protein S18 acetylase RimI-like enzyme
VNQGQSEDPYEVAAPLLNLAADWLAVSEGTNIPLELAFHELRWREGWRLSIYRTPKEIEGVSVVLPRAHWYLESRRPPVAEMLSNMAVIHGHRPATLTTSAQIGDWLRPFLQETGGISSEQEVSLLRCAKPIEAQEGRWATADDLPQLRKYQERIDRNQQKYLDHSWNVLIALKALAVFGRGNSIVGSIRRYGPAPHYAGISDLFVLPDAQRDEIAAKLVGFVVKEILAQRKAVYVLVDKQDAAALSFYRALGFEDQQTFYRAYLE